MCDRIEKCDTIVAEMTEQNSCVGFEVGLAYAQNKKILVVYQRQEGQRLSSTIEGIDNGTTRMVREYGSDEELDKILWVFFAFSKLG